MNLSNNEKELINNYIPTLKRYFKKKNNFKYFKNPFIENFIFKFVLINNDEALIEKIIDKINDNIISTEDVSFSLNYYYNFSKNEKMKIQTFLYNNDENEMILFKLKTNIILFLIKYFQYYYIINELLFEDDEQELFYAIYIFSKNNENDIKNYSKKYFKMKIFFSLIDDLSKIYKKNLDILAKNDIVSNSGSFKFFVKNIFFDWHIFYKEALENDNFIHIDKKYEIKPNLFYKFVCSHNIC
jgi:hypothetical protein